MAKRIGRSLEVVSRKTPTPKRTSIGKSRKSRPLNKHKKKTKRRSKKAILLALETKKKKELKKEFQKQKDLLSHRWGK